MRKIAAIIIISIVISGEIVGQKSISNDFISTQKKFIKNLYAQKMYFDCISETRRLLNYNPGILNYIQYNYFIQGCYFLGGQYKSVISHFSKDKKIIDLKFPYLIILSQAYLNLGLYTDSLIMLGRIDYQEIEGESRYELLLRRNEIFFLKSEYENAIKEIENSKKYLAGRESDLYKMKDDINNYRGLGPRLKWISVLLSTFFPGGGQVYSGRYMDGAISLVSVLGSALGTYYLHKRGEKSLSLTLGFFCSLFYAGNIYGAYNSAEKSNMDHDNNFKSLLKKKYIPHYNPMQYIDINGIMQ